MKRLFAAILGSLLMACATPAFAGDGVVKTMRTTTSAWPIGPSFECAKADAPLAQIICGSEVLSRLDLEFAQAYYALRYEVGAEGRAALLQEAQEFQDSVLDKCGIPASGDPPPLTSALTVCINAEYKQQRHKWLSRLSGPALDEAIAPIGVHVEIQRDLQNLGFLPASAQIDGVYGDETRAAITAWQHANHAPVTGFVDKPGAVAILYEGAMQWVNRQPGMKEATPAAIPAPAAAPPSSPNDWYYITKSGGCKTEEGFTPAYVMKLHQRIGILDDPVILARENGDPVEVQVFEPEENDIARVFTFFRGRARCEAYLAHQFDGLN